MPVLKYTCPYCKREEKFNYNFILPDGVGCVHMFCRRRDAGEFTQFKLIICELSCLLCDRIPCSATKAYINK